MNAEQRDDLNRELYLLAHAETDRQAIFDKVDTMLVAERERCATECERIRYDYDGPDCGDSYLNCAVAIRALT